MVMVMVVVLVMLLVLTSMVSMTAAFLPVRSPSSMTLNRGSSSKLSMLGEAELDDATRGKLETLVGENKVNNPPPFSLTHP